MATYALTGTGVQALTSGTTALHITITTIPPIAGNGRANPTNWYDVALLRLGDATAYFDAVPVVGGPQWMAVPSGATRFGYTCLFGAAISVAEVIGGTPPFGGGGTLSTLSDVAVTSPTDTQVLTYQASSAKWVNAAAAGGGGGAGIGTYRASARRNAAISQANNTTVLLNWDQSVQDNDSMLQVGGAHPNRITTPHAGVYLVLFAVQSTGSGAMAITFAKNTDATSYPSGTPDVGGNYVGAPTLYSVQSMSAGDYLSFYSYMGLNSGNIIARASMIAL